MADDQTDDSQKTEDPTPRRIEEAREKGQVARSQEVNHWFAVLAMTLVMTFFAAPMVRGITNSLYRLIERPAQIKIGTGELRQVMMETLGGIGLAVLAPLAVLVAAAILAGLIQNGLVISTEPIKPKLEKVSPARGLKRLFSSRSLVEFAKGLTKIAIIGTVLIVLLRPEFGVIPNITGMNVAQFLALVQGLAIRVLVAVLAVMTIIAALDFLYQKQQHLKQLRMSKQELRDEHKQSEGDPMVKARLRQIRVERARKRMMAAVPEADVVITNPTHYSVALKYDAETMGAPKLIAKGVDSLAMRIRELAQTHDVPIVENPPLTRALYESVELDHEIPPEHYRAVAEVIGYVMRLKGNLRHVH
jgi:flagellar biosynthetic protein FlhB